jgi:hypothetical protein
MTALLCKRDCFTMQSFLCSCGCASDQDALRGAHCDHNKCALSLLLLLLLLLQPSNCNVVGYMNKMLGQAWLDGGPAFLQQNGLELAQSQVASHSNLTILDYFTSIFTDNCTVLYLTSLFHHVPLATDTVCRMLL